MPSILEFEPLLAETILTVRARLDQDINAGLDPTDANWADTTEGSVYWDATQGPVLEITRGYDFAATEVAAACFPAFAWGVYLDYHGDTINKLRKDAVRATGAVRMAGTPGSLVATGTRLSAVQVDPDVDPPTFATTASVVLASSPGPTGLAATPSATGGTLGPHTAFYVVTAIDADGYETVVSNEEQVEVPAGDTASVDLDWTSYTGATAYRVYRGTVRGRETLLAETTASDYTDTGADTPGSVGAPTNLVPIEAEAAGPEANVASGMIALLLSPVAGVESVINPQPCSGGADVESDDLYRRRILLAWSTPQGAGNVGDYERWALDYPAVGYVTVVPLWAGPGTVHVIVTDQQNNPVSDVVLDGLQAQLDPVPEHGAGLAPIGATVTVSTPTLLEVDVDATLVLQAGYSLDGDAGTIPVRADVLAALDTYVNRLRPGDDVILGHVLAQFFSVGGVEDVTGLLLDGAATNAVVGPTEVAVLGTVTLA